MANPFVAEIRVVGFNFAPTGWATCDGQLLPLSQNTALFSLLGTMYGGDGKSTFALPDIQGQAVLGAGQGQGLSDHLQGEVGGSQTVTLLQSEIPAHTHDVAVDNATVADQTAPDTDRALARSRPGRRYQSTTNQNLADTAPQSVWLNGGSLPHNNLSPALTLNYIIALQGVFPQRP